MKYFVKLFKKFITKKNIAYLFINMGNIPIMTVIGSFLAVYYVDILRMNEYAVGTMFLIARIFDGINDPIIGGMIDRIPGNKLKKFNRTLVVGSVVCAINYIILWLGPAFACSNLKMSIAYISYLFLGITFPIMDISLNSLLPVLGKDREERESLSSIKVIGYGIGTVMIEIIIPIILSRFGTTVNVYSYIVFGIVAIVIAFTAGGACGLKNTVCVANMNLVNKEIKGISSFISIFTEKNVWGTFLSGLFFYTANAMLAVSNTYYTIYYLGDVKYLVYITIATYALEILVVLFVSIFTRKWGIKKVFIIGLLISGIGLFMRFVPCSNVKNSFIALLISSAIYGLGYGFVMILFYSIQAENVDTVYKQTGFQAEGTIAALMSMINKIGKGIGGALPLYILGVMKLADGTYSKLSLRIIDGLMPAVLFIIAGCIFFIKYQEY